MIKKTNKENQDLYNELKEFATAIFNNIKYIVLSVIALWSFCMGFTWSLTDYASYADIRLIAIEATAYVIFGLLACIAIVKIFLDIVKWIMTNKIQIKVVKRTKRTK